MSFEAVEIDIYKAIRELHAEKIRLDQVIAALEELQNRGNSPTGPAVGRRRGRKSMKADEREQVSVRMKQYWARRRSKREVAD